jgi:hypothetical protein
MVELKSSDSISSFYITEAYTKNEDGRFVQVKGNVNPELIHETLYDSQQLREPTRKSI